MPLKTYDILLSLDKITIQKLLTLHQLERLSNAMLLQNKKKINFQLFVTWIQICLRMKRYTHNSNPFFNVHFSFTLLYFVRDFDSTTFYKSSVLGIVCRDNFIGYCYYFTNVTKWDKLFCKNEEISLDNSSVRNKWFSYCCLRI